MNFKIIVSIMLNILITLIVGLNRDYRDIAHVILPIFGVFILVSIIGVILIVTGKKKPGAIMVIVGCAAFVPIGLIGIFGAKKVLADAKMAPQNTTSDQPAVAAPSARRVLTEEEKASRQKKVRIAFGIFVAIAILIYAAISFTPPSDTKFMRAVEDSDFESVKEMLKKGANPNAKNADGYSALHIAAMKNSMEITKALLDKNADIKVLDNMGATPLFSAAQTGKTGIVQLFLEKGADINFKNAKLDDQTALHIAAFGGYEDTVKLLIEKGADVNARDRNGFTPLCSAIASQNINAKPAIVMLLLEKGADVNAKDNSGSTPLKVARGWGAYNIVDILVKKGGK